MSSNIDDKLLNDEELDGIAGGITLPPDMIHAVTSPLASDPLAGAHTSLAGATLMHGTNPLYVDNTHLAGPSAPVYTPHPAAITPPPAVATVSATPAHDSGIVVVNPSGMGQSLDIPSHAATQPVISSTVTMVIPTVNITADKTPPPVTVLTFDQHSGFTTVVPTIDPKRSAGTAPHAGTHSPLETSTDLSLTN